MVNSDRWIKSRTDTSKCVSADNEKERCFGLVRLAFRVVYLKQTSMQETIFFDNGKMGTKKNCLRCPMQVCTRELAGLMFSEFSYVRTLALIWARVVGILVSSAEHMRKIKKKTFLLKTKMFFDESSEFRNFSTCELVINFRWNFAKFWRLLTYLPTSEDWSDARLRK